MFKIQYNVRQSLKNMFDIPYNVQETLKALVPASLYNNISCFVFYDNHPKDERNIDVIICTNGEVIELFQREIISSTTISCKNPEKIKIFRNRKLDLFYLISNNDTLTILSRKEVLTVHKVITDIDSYHIDDSMCSGQASVKIIKKDDAVPLTFDENFENLNDNIIDGEQVEDSYPVLTNLMRNVTFAKYTVKQNEQKYKQYMKLRQTSAYNAYQKKCPSEDSVRKEKVNAISIKTKKPFVKLCHKKIVIVFILSHNNPKSIEDIQILLHGTSQPSLVYITRLFEKSILPPFWIEKSLQKVTKEELALVAVIDLEELQKTVMNKIEFNGVISYRHQGQENILPFDNVLVSAMDIMGEQFDVLSSDLNDEQALLAVLATLEKTSLCLRHIETAEDSHLVLADMFCNALKMEKVLDKSDMFIHKISPYHTLHGMLVVQEKEIGDGVFLISVFARSPTQVTSLIHLINDSVPHRILITTQNYKITAKTEEFSKYNEDHSTPLEFNVKTYANSLVNQTKLTLEYFDRCMVSMNNSKNPVVRSKIGSEIDVFAEGIATFSAYRNKLLEEAKKGIEDAIANSVDDEMIDNIAMQD